MATADGAAADFLPRESADRFTQVIGPAAGRRGVPFSTKWEGVAEGDGWGVESRFATTKVRGAACAIMPASKLRPTPHPALRATFPQQATSKLGKGSARRLEMCGGGERKQITHKRPGKLQ